MVIMLIVLPLHGGKTLMRGPTKQNKTYFNNMQKHVLHVLLESAYSNVIFCKRQKPLALAIVLEGLC